MLNITTERQPRTCLRYGRLCLALSVLAVLLLGGAAASSALERLGLFSGTSSTGRLIVVDLLNRTATAAGAQQGSLVRGIRCQESILQMVQAHRRTARVDWQLRLAEAIYAESLAAGVDPFTVASIVATESSFKSRVVSSAGAVGLMQLRPFVAKNVAQRSSIEWNGTETLHSPDRNLRLGILYYKELLERFEGDREKALTAYNYGPTRVSGQVARGTYRGSSYANKIINLYDSLKLERAG
jgi:soluble lytic murein transglycosylase-like protein